MKNTVSEQKLNNNKSAAYSKLKNNSWFLHQKVKIFFHSDEFRVKTSYLKASILALVAGVIISFIIIGANNSNPLQFFVYVFQIAFNWRFLNDTLNYWTIYILGGLAVAVAFKSGMFNIGVSGQMMLAGSMTIVFSLKNPAISQAGGIIGGICISLVVGAGLAAIAGILKAYFNIHEVVTTIMLNWIVWYLMKWMFMDPSNNMWNPGFNISIEPPLTTAIGASQFTWIIPLIIALVAVVFVIFIFNYTVLGFRIKAVGSSYNASLYAGTNVRFYVIISMTISGALAGLMGFSYYMTELRQIQFSTDILPSIGFDVITVALVAFLNGYAVIPVAMLWAIIKVAVLPTTQFPEFQMSKQMGQLIFGIMIYMMAISALFFKFKPIFWFKRWYKIYSNAVLKKQVNEIRKNIKILKKEIIKENKKYHSERWKVKDKKELQLLKEKTNNILTIIVGKIKTEKSNLKFITAKMYKESKKYGIAGIKNRYQKAMFGSLASALDQYVELKNSLLVHQNEILKSKKQFVIEKNKIKNATYQKLSLLPWKNNSSYYFEKYSKLLNQQTQSFEKYENQKNTITEKYLILLKNNYQSNKNDVKSQIYQEKIIFNQQKKEIARINFQYYSNVSRLIFKKWLIKGLFYIVLCSDKVINYCNYKILKEITKIYLAYYQATKKLKSKHLAEIKVINDNYKKSKKTVIDSYNYRVSLIIADVKEDVKILKTELQKKIISWKENKRNNNIIYISEGSTT